MKTLTKILLICCLLWCGSEELQAGVIGFHQRIGANLNGCGSPITVGDTCARSIVSVYPKTGSFRDYNLQD
ncbi:MAG TPA: hypothetical protein VNZ45_18190, partial [Bacteroidia bacterium]|nr:hypothetical protein [Bacteroidia bacterium]